MKMVFQNKQYFQKLLKILLITQQYLQGNLFKILLIIENLLGMDLGWWVQSYALYVTVLIIWSRTVTIIHNILANTQRPHLQIISIKRINQGRINQFGIIQIGLTIVISQKAIGTLIRKEHSPNPQYLQEILLKVLVKQYFLKVLIGSFPIKVLLAKTQV